jgi:hypothetical protein
VVMNMTVCEVEQPPDVSYESCKSCSTCICNEKELCLLSCCLLFSDLSGFEYHPGCFWKIRVLWQPSVLSSACLVIIEFFLSSMSCNKLGSIELFLALIQTVETTQDRSGVDLLAFLFSYKPVKT